MIKSEQEFDEGHLEELRLQSRIRSEIKWAESMKALPDSQKVAHGLLILAKYRGSIWGRHEKIGFTGPDIDEMSLWDVLMLKMIDWYWESDGDGDPSWVFITD